MTVASASSTSSTSSTASTPTSGDGGLKRIVLYILRRDLRVSDNPILHHLATADHGFTHLIPVFVVPPHQVEVSGFLQNGTSSPYPEARSQVGGYWRCGPRRAKFLAQSVWDLRQSLEDIGSGLLIRIGSYEHVVSDLLAGLDTSHSRVDAVWMTKEDTSEEVDDQEAVSRVCDRHKVEFKRWMDEKYFLDDRDLNLGSDGIHDVFTDFRKSQEPLREKPRAVLPTPAKSTLPPFPDDSTKIPRQSLPFDVPASLDDFEDRLTKPVKHPISDAPAWPQGALSAHPFEGGETNAQARLHHLIVGGHMVTYKDTRNGLIGKDYSTKLAAYLALGCITARQVHGLLVKFENGTDERFENTTGYGNGENEGTAAVRLELMWRDYMRLCARKFGNRLFRLSGFGKSNPDKKAYTWRSADKNSAPASQTETPEEIGRIIGRFLRGTTGMSLIDASQRELYLTGYTSNRARQNVANFFAKHLGIDWRYGAEWYESMLIDYDPSSNWCNWQYVAGVGNDPRGRERIFNPVKQGFEYDPNGRYVKMWVPELRAIERLENVFQPWTTPRAEMLPNGLVGLELAEDPVKKIAFLVSGRPKNGNKNGRANGNGSPPNGTTTTGDAIAAAAAANGNSSSLSSSSSSSLLSLSNRGSDGKRTGGYQFGRGAFGSFRRGQQHAANGNGNSDSSNNNNSSTNTNTNTNNVNANINGFGNGVTIPRAPRASVQFHQSGGYLRGRSSGGFGGYHHYYQGGGYGYHHGGNHPWGYGGGSGSGGPGFGYFGGGGGGGHGRGGYHHGRGGGGGGGHGYGHAWHNGRGGGYSSNNGRGASTV